MLAITGIRDWPRFQEYQDTANERLNEASLKDRDRRNAGEHIAPNGMSRYDVGSTSRLAELVGFNNVGVKYRPDWTSKVVAEAWVTNEKEKAAKSRDAKRIEFATKWGVQAVDMDNDPRTPDNVIPFSDQVQGKIKAIDGHYLIPH
jgi:hypothetical protein